MPYKQSANSLKERKNLLYLAQTDTTAGFLSKDEREINKAKGRALQTPCILTMSSLKELVSLVRVPKAHKNLVRKAKKTSFIYKKARANENSLNLSGELADLGSENLGIKGNFKGKFKANSRQNALKVRDFNKPLSATLKDKPLQMSATNGFLACRVVKDCAHAEFLREFGAFFSSSANLHGQAFSKQIARQITLQNGGQIIDESLFWGAPSALIKLYRHKKVKIR